MKSTKEFASEILNKWGLQLTSEYTGAHKPVEFLCTNGHKNSGAATNVLQRGYKCKECVAGHKVDSKIDWTDKLISELLEFLWYNTTKDAAKKFNTTVSAINNVLAKNELSNPRDRMAERNLCNALLKQDRELLNLVGDLATVKCSKGHVHAQTPSNILQHNTGCPSCFSLGISGMEKELLSFIQTIYSGWIVTKDRSILEGRELDIVLPDEGLAIEFNGTYWHNEDKVGRHYHQDKTNRTEAFGYQLLHVKDYDWYNKKEIIKSIISSKLGITTKIFARKCTVRDISFPRAFLDANHIQGAGQPTPINKGLFLGEELVAVATFATPRFGNTEDLELMRFCSKLNTTVVGGLSKLLSKVQGSIISYASRDFSTGKAYKAVGFTLCKVTEPGLEYYYKYERLSRYAAQSVDDLSKYHRYYNSGNLVFVREANQIM